MKMLSATLAFLCVSLAFSAVYDRFETDAGWVHSDDSSKGKMVLSKGKWKGDQGFQTSQDAKFYAVAKKVDTISNDGKDLVLSFSVTHEQNIDCGGGYIKLLPDFDLKTFNGETPYEIMFGPDICGATKKIHLIFNYKGKNLLWKKEPRCESDTLTHFYTMVLKPDNTYEVYVDFVKKESGKLEDDWDFLAPKTIADPNDKKPSDWVDQSEIPDPSDVKPSDWDKESATIADPEATKPDDWDEEEDGAWEAPTVPNPKFKGEWKPKQIPNPAYKGEWKPRQIANPDYSEDDKIYRRKDVSVAGFDLWQVKSGTIFDNIVVSNSFDDAKRDYEAYKPLLEKEKKAFEDSEKKTQEAATAKPQTEEDEDEEEEEEKERHDEL
jgi:calreticulin